MIFYIEAIIQKVDLINLSTILEQLKIILIVLYFETRIIGLRKKEMPSCEIMMKE